MTANRETLQAAVLEAQAALNKLLEVEKLLEAELPTARSALKAAEKKLREATRPSRATIREAELQLLNSKINEAQGGAQNVY